mgnify:CR=1 FL=1
MNFQKYTNPPLPLAERAMIPQTNNRFREIIETLIVEFDKANPPTYCSTHHSVETRNSISQHFSCNTFTKALVVSGMLIF